MDTLGVVFGITSAAVVLVITLVTTAHQVLRASSLGLKTTLSQILLRDGVCMTLVAAEIVDDVASSGSMFFLSVLLFRCGIGTDQDLI